MLIKIAKRFFQIDKQAALNIHNENAHDFLSSTSLKFDLLVADLYDHNGIDEGQLQQQFIKDSANALSDSGWLVLNYWLDHALTEDLLNQLNQQFECIYICNSGGGNSIIYAGKNQPQADFIDKEKTKSLAKTLGFSLNYYLKRLKAFTA
jgi:spermidine synthase